MSGADEEKERRRGLFEHTKANFALYERLRAHINFLGLYNK